MPSSGTKTPGGFGGDYISQGSRELGGASHSVRRKINAQKLGLIRAWKRNLVSTLKVGVGLDNHLDTAMRELIEELQEWIDAPE